jgi:hypothetical protein
LKETKVPQGSTGKDKHKKEKKLNTIKVITCQIIHGGFQPRIQFFSAGKKEFLLAQNYRFFFFLASMNAFGLLD